MTGMPLFDQEEALKARDEGMLRARNAGERQALLVRARGVAESIAVARGEVTADDVVLWYKEHQDVDLTSRLGNAMGSLFKGPRWKWTGRFAVSERVHAHGNRLMIWRLV